jgi:uncharacterized protein GlcG (DUF336 family)
MMTLRLKTLALALPVLMTGMAASGVAQNLPYGAPISIELAKQAAAKAASGIKSPTKAIQDLIVTQNQISLLGVPGAFPVEGGVPLVVDGAFVGAIGASGGMLPDDGAVATTGANSLHP